MGALVLADEVPAKGQVAWLRLEEPASTGWVKANVVRRAGVREVGLDLAEHCPCDLFRAATQGAQASVAVPPEFADGHGR
jgi:hypothetical protein